MLTPMLMLAAAFSMPAETLATGPSTRWPALRAHADTMETWTVVGGKKQAGRPHVRRMWKEGAGRQARWCVEVVYADTSGAVETRQYAEAAAQTLAPMRIAVKSPGDSCDVRVENGQFAGYVAPARKPRREFAEPASRGAFAHEFTAEVIAAQALREGWRAIVTDIEPYRDGEVAFTREARVRGRERLTLGGQKVECWLVDIAEPRGMVRTIWIDVKSHRVWQVRGRASNGSFEWVERVRAQ